MQCKKKAQPPDPLEYDLTAIVISLPEKRIPLADAQKLTQDAIADGKLTAASVSGATPGSDEEISLHIILAAVASKDRWGREFDLIEPIGFAPAGGGAAPVGKVTVRIDTAGKGEAVLISAGAPVAPTTYAKRDDAEKVLKSKYGISEVRDGSSTWTVEELNIVLAAFARIPSGDIVALKGVALERVDVVSGDGDSAGEFSTEQSASGTSFVDEATLQLADSVFPATPASFVGGKGNEAPAGYLTILHEVGHAVEVQALRDAAGKEMRAIAARNERVEEQGQALDTENAELDALNTLVDEFNTLTAEANAATDELAAAKKSGDKDAIAAAKAARDAKLKERTDKGKEVTAQRAKFNKAKRAEQIAAQKVKAATTTTETLAGRREQATARPTLLARAKRAEAAAVAALRRAKAAKDKTADSEAYRTAADEAGQALAKLADAVNKKQEDVSDLQSDADRAVTNMETERDNLASEHPDDPAVATYGPVATAQRTWLDALVLTIESGDQSARLRKFIDFVTEKKILPFTKYARDNWPDKPGEFFAEAYSLFLSDPEYLKTNSPLLHDWFRRGSYR